MFIKAFLWVLATSSSHPRFVGRWEVSRLSEMTPHPWSPQGEDGLSHRALPRPGLWGSGGSEKALGALGIPGGALREGRTGSAHRNPSSAQLASVSCGKKAVGGSPWDPVAFWNRIIYVHLAREGSQDNSDYLLHTLYAPCSLWVPYL